MWIPTVTVWMHRFICFFMVQIFPKHIFSCNIAQFYFHLMLSTLGPVVQSIVSLTSSLRVISLTVLADLIHNILIFFAEKI